jgi:hypothetical protein
VSCSNCGREREKAFHTILQEFSEVGSFRTTHQNTAIPIERKGCENKGVQEQSSSPMVPLYVDFRPAQEATETCEKA